MQAAFIPVVDPSALSNLMSNSFHTRDSPLFSVRVPPQAPQSPIQELMAWMGCCYSHLFLSISSPLFPPDCPLRTQRQQIFHSDSQRDAGSLQGITISKTHFSSSRRLSLQPAGTPHCLLLLINSGFQPQITHAFLSSLVPKTNKLA